MVIFVLLLPSILLFSGLYLLESLFWAFTLFYGWLALMPLLFCRWRALSFRKCGAVLNWNFNLPSSLMGLSTGLFFLAVIYSSLSLLQAQVLDVNGINTSLARWGLSGIGLRGLVFMLVLVNPLLEEVYWRGTAQALLPDSYSFGAKNAITAGFYSLYHLLTIAVIFRFPLNLLGVLPVFIAGLCWGVLKKHYGLWAAILSHALADGGIILIYLKFIH